MEKPGRYEAQAIEPMIPTIRGQKVILDADLARIYRVPTKRLNEQVRRNADRFPPDFTFVLTDHKVTNLKSQFATSSLSLNRPSLLLCTSHLPRLPTSQNFQKDVYYKLSTPIPLPRGERARVRGKTEANIKIDSPSPGRMGTFYGTLCFGLQNKHRTSIRNNVRRQDLDGQALITFITEGR